MTQACTTIYPNVQEQKTFRMGLASIRRDLLPPEQLRDVFEDYHISARQVTNVVEFLSAHKQLASILLEAVPHIRRIFGQSPVYLEVERDPDEGSEELFGVVMASADPERALALLAQFDEEWFARVARRARSMLNFTVDTVTG